MGSQLWDRFRRARGGIDPAVVASTVNDTDPNRRAAGMAMLGIEATPDTRAQDTEDRQTVSRAFAAVRQAGVEARRQQVAQTKQVAAQQKLQTTVQKEHGYVLQHDPATGGMVPQLGPTGKPLKRVPGSTEHFVEEGNEGRFWNRDPATGGWVDAYENPKAVRHVKGGRVMVTPRGLPSKDVGEDEDSAVAAMANAHVLQTETDIAAKRRPTATALHEASRDNKLAKDRLEYLTKNATPQSEKVTPEELAKMRLDAKAAYQSSKSRLNDAQEKHNAAVAETEELNVQLPLAKESIRRKKFENVLGVNFREKYRAGTVAQGLDAGDPTAVATARAAQGEAHAQQVREFEGLDATKAGEAHGAFVKDLQGRIAAHTKAGEEHKAQVEAFNAPLVQNAQQQDMLKAQSDAHLAADPSGMIQVTVGGQAAGAWHKDEFAKVKQVEAQKVDYLKANDRRVKFLNDRGNGLNAQAELLNADVKHADTLRGLVGQKAEAEKQAQYDKWEKTPGLDELARGSRALDDQRGTTLKFVEAKLEDAGVQRGTPAWDAAVQKVEDEISEKRKALFGRVQKDYTANLNEAALSVYGEAPEILQAMGGREARTEKVAKLKGVSREDLKGALDRLEALDFVKHKKPAVLVDGQIAVNPANTGRLADYKKAVEGVEGASEEAKKAALARFDEVHGFQQLLQSPEKLKGGVDAAVESGAVSREIADKYREQLESAGRAYAKLEKEAGGEAKAKALLRGAGKGAAFLAGAELTAPIGAEVGAWTGPAAPVMAPLLAGIFGLGGGYLTSSAYDKTLEGAGMLSNAVNAFNAAAQLHPGWAAGGELAAFATGAPAAIKNLSKVAGIATKAGESGTKTVLKVLGVGAAGGAAFEGVVRPAFDAALEGVKKLVGLKTEDVQAPTVESLLTNTALGVLLAGRQVAFKDYSPSEIANIMLRGRARSELGMNARALLKPEEIVEAMKRRGVDVPPELAELMSHPLDANEASVWEALAKKTKQMEASGAFDGADPQFEGAEQAVVPGLRGKGTPITSAVVEAKSREGGAKERAPEPSPGLPEGGADALTAASDAELESHPEPLEARRAGLLRAIAQGSDISTFSEENLNLLGLERRQGSDKITAIKDVAPDVHVDGKGNAIILDHARDELLQKFPATGDFLKMTEAEARAHFKSGQSSTTGTTPERPQKQPEKSKVAKVEESQAQPGTSDGEIEPNQHGVYPQDKAETLTYPGKKATAKLRVLKVGDVWISASDFSHRQGSMLGAGGPLTMHQSHASREEALDAAARELIERNQHVLTDGSSMVTEGQKTEARAIIEWAKQHLLPGKAKNVPRRTPDKPKKSGGASNRQSSEQESGEALTTETQAKPKAREVLQTGFAAMGERQPPATLSAHIASVVEAHEPLFDGVREGKLPDSRGFAYDANTGELVIDPAQVVEAMAGLEDTSLEAVTKHLETTIDEEVKHRVTMGLEKRSPKFARDLAAVWEALPAEKKAESAAIYFNRPGAKFDHDHTAKHEWFRQVWQKAERGELTEESLGSKNLLEKVRDLIKTLIDSLTAWVKSAPKEIRGKLNDILKAARRAEAGLRGKVSGDVSTPGDKPVPPAPNGPEPSRVGQAGSGDPERAGKLAKKADEWEAMAAKHDADGNASAAASARLKAQKFREAAALETAATHLEDSGKVHNVEALKDAAAEAEQQASTNPPESTGQEKPAASSTPQEITPKFKDGDRVTFERDGKTLTGTVRSVWSDSVTVDVDQIARPGGVPIGRVESVPPDDLRMIEAERPKPEPANEPPAKPEPVQPVQDGGNLPDAAPAIPDIELPDDLASLGAEFKDLLGGDPISSPAPPKAELAESGFKSEGEAREQYRLRGLTQNGETFEEFLARNHCLELGGRNNFSIL